jgi:hypothetical protein
MSFQLPEGKSLEVVMVRLKDGRMVARTKEELEELPAEERGAVTGSTKGQT